MSGCFGGSSADRHFEGQLMAYLDDTHHPHCKANEANESDWPVDEEGFGIQPECNCDEHYADDKCDAQLDAMGDY